jgi:hypothetical protein
MRSLESVKAAPARPTGQSCTCLETIDRYYGGPRDTHPNRTLLKLTSPVRSRSPGLVGSRRVSLLAEPRAGAPARSTRTRRSADLGSAGASIRARAQGGGRVPGGRAERRTKARAVRRAKLDGDGKRCRKGGRRERCAPSDGRDLRAAARLPQRQAVQATVRGARVFIRESALRRAPARAASTGLRCSDRNLDRQVR